MIYVYEMKKNKIKKSSYKGDGSRFSGSIDMDELKDDSTDIVAVNADDILLVKDAIKAKVFELANKGRKANVVVEGCGSFDPLKRIEHTFNGGKLLKLCELDQELRKFGMEGQIKFNEYFPISRNSGLSGCWNLDQVLDANEKIREIVWKIRKLELSPYETMVYIHKYLTQNYGYGTNADENCFISGAEKDASIISTFQNKQTICTGFASMTKAIIDELNIPELTCKYQPMTCWKKLEEPDELGRKIKYNGKHALSLITVNDPKYNIKGTYIDDATWDCKDKDYPYGKGYAFFMYPVSNILKMKRMGLSPIIGGTRIFASRFEYDDFGKLPEMDSKDKPIPIPFDTFEKAVKRVYSLEKDFCRDNDPVKTGIKDITNSLIEALIIQADDNPLAQKADTLYTATYVYDENNNIKNVKIELKEKDSEMERS